MTKSTSVSDRSCRSCCLPAPLRRKELKKERGPPARGAGRPAKSAGRENGAEYASAASAKRPETTGQASPDVKSGERGKTPQTTGQAPSKGVGSPQKGEIEKAEIRTRVLRSHTPQGDNKTNGGREQAKSNESRAKQRTTTTGQGAAAGNAKLSTEQRTKITTIFRAHRVVLRI